MLLDACSHLQGLPIVDVYLADLPNDEVSCLLVDVVGLDGGGGVVPHVECDVLAGVQLVVLPGVRLLGQTTFKRDKKGKFIDSKSGFKNLY